MIKIEIQIDDRRVRQALDGLIAAGSDTTELMADIARLLRNAAEDGFQVR